MKNWKEMNICWWIICIFQFNPMSCASLNHKGNALLEFKKRVMNDPNGALSSWDEKNGEANSCSWFGVECAGGHVVSLHDDWPENDEHPRRLLQHVHESNGQESNEMTTANSSHEESQSHPGSGPQTLDSNDSHRTLPSSPTNNPIEPSAINLPPPPPRLNHDPSAAPPPSAVLNSSPSNLLVIVLGMVGGAIGLALLIGLLLLYLFKRKKIRKAGPWSTGFSGQLQKAFVVGNVRSDGFHNDSPSFVEGIPNLKRSELQTACEDFSNVIGSSSLGTIYKGTLPNGVEIAVITLGITSAKDWSKNLEAQFRNKIKTLSKVNHKNFVNLIGYCEKENPFTRLMVFEYAPNGSLFEHLHVREAEHLDWAMRLRVAMGMSYCLEHMHQLTPPVIHPNLNSSAVSLSEDYAAKVSDFCFWNEVAARRVHPMITNTLTITSLTPASNVLTFGLVLLEMMTGRIPQSLENNSVNDWVLEYMRGELDLQEMVDPMLRHYDLDQLDKIGEVIRKCLLSEQNRPTMRDVTTRLKEVTGINQDKAAPRFSSLWWADLES